MVNLDDLLKELKSNKEIKFDKLKEEFIKDDVIIDVPSECQIHKQIIRKRPEARVIPGSGVCRYGV